jgi:tripartite-type tricarboxylate transporter receptor subunit TctC
MPNPFSTSMQRRLVLAAAASGVAAPFMASAQSFPNRPIRMIVPFTAGGATDVLARTLAQNMSSALGQPIIIDNKAGSSGSIGLGFVAQSATDGYTLLFTNFSPLVINPHLMPQAASINSFSPVSAFAYIPQVLASSRHTVFSALSGREVTFGNHGNGTLAHIMAVMVARSANLRANHIPYRGTAPMLTDMMANQFDVAISTAIYLEQYRASGKLNYLAVTSPIPLLPNVPTFDQLGIGDATLNDWYGVLAPAGTPTAIISQLNNALIRAVNSPDVQQRIKSLGALPQLSSPEQFGLLIRSYFERVGKAIRENGITVG